MTDRARNEQGWAAVITVIVVAAMLSLGFATYAFVGGQQKQSAGERISESSFNLAEGVLDAQAFLLGRNWPATADKQYPPACSSAVALPQCPDPTRMAATFNETDFAASTAWTTSVRDNQPDVDFYDPAAVESQPRWDANGDRRVWIRAQAVVRGQPRTLVSLVEVNVIDDAATFPHNAVTAGHMSVGNLKANNPIIDMRDAGGQSSQVVVRCTGTPSTTGTCLRYDPNKNQIAPNNFVTGYAGGDALSDDALDRLKARAIAEGTYTATGCPKNLNGAVVFIDDTGGLCRYGDEIKPCCNSATAPGLLVVRRGTLEMDGNLTFYGIIYMANRQSSSGDVLTFGGGFTLQGAVAVDRDGGFVAGANQRNLVWDPSVFRWTLQSFASAGILQNTWREIKG